MKYRVHDGKNYLKIQIPRVLTLVPVQAATTSWIVQGVTMTMKPKDMAAIVLDAFVLSRLSCATNCNNYNSAHYTYEQ